MSSKEYRRTRETFVWGLFLIGLGIMFLFTNSGVWPNDTFRHWWPVFVIVAGLGSLFRVRGPKGVGSAVGTAATGVWLLVANNGWYGLGWSRSWPLVLVAAGLGAFVEAIVASFWRGAEGDSHV